MERPIVPFIFMSIKPLRNASEVEYEDTHTSAFPVCDNIQWSSPSVCRPLPR